MTCPFCQEEMKEGYVWSNRFMWWIKQQPSWSPAKSVLADAEKLGSHGLKDYYLGSYTKAFRCEKCRKVLFDY